MISIYHTPSQYLARTVLDVVTTQGHDARFRFQDGTYHVYVVSRLGRLQAKALQQVAWGLDLALAQAFVPKSLADFKQIEVEA